MGKKGREMGLKKKKKKQNSGNDEKLMRNKLFY